MSGPASGGATVVTALGPVPGAALGRVDAHEHVFLRSPVLPGEEFVDLEPMCTELADVARSGVRTVVDLTPVGLGRRPADTAELSRRTGVHVVLATGMHRRAHYPPGHWGHTVGVEELTEILLVDLREGIDARDWQGPRPAPTDVRAGVVKLGASYHRIEACERRWIQAGVAAALTAGVPVAVHTEVGTAAHDVLDLLGAEGLPPQRVMLAHLDRNVDAGLHAELAARGAFLGYDTVGRTKYHGDATVLGLVADMAAAGHAGQVLLGTDVGRRSTLRAYGGGPGMDVLGRVFLPRLRRELGADLEETLMTTNPRRWLTGEDGHGA